MRRVSLRYTPVISVVVSTAMDMQTFLPKPNPAGTSDGTGTTTPPPVIDLAGDTVAERRESALETERVIPRNGRQPTENEWAAAFWMLAKADVVQKMCKGAVTSGNPESSDTEYAFVKNLQLGADQGVVTVLNYAGGASVPAQYEIPFALTRVPHTPIVMIRPY